MATTYMLNLNLLRLQQARQIKDENPYTGQEELGVFIPYEPNNIWLSRCGYPYLTIFLNPMTVETGKWSHYAMPGLTSEKLKEMKDEGTIQREFIGRMRRLRTT